MAWHSASLDFVTQTYACFFAIFNFIILQNEVLNSFLYINESEYMKYSYMWTAEEIWNSDIFVDITVASYALVNWNPHPPTPGAGRGINAAIPVI